MLQNTVLLRTVGPHRRFLAPLRPPAPPLFSTRETAVSVGVVSMPLLSVVFPDETLLLADFGIAAIIPPGETVISGVPCGTKVRGGSVPHCNS